jgi:hypothetical protein
MEGVVVLGSLMSGVAGMAAASSFHGQRRDDGPYLLQRDQSRYQNAPTQQYGASEGQYDFWNTMDKSRRENGSAQNLQSRPTFQQQQNRNSNNAYDFWNSVDKRVPASYGIKGPTTKEVGPYFRTSSSSQHR